MAVVSYGVIMGMAVKVADRLAEQGYSVSLVSCHTLKPLDHNSIAEILSHHKRVIVIEEHAPQGGLAPQTKQIAWDIKAKCELHCFTLKDEFIHCYGSHGDILAAHGIGVETIMKVFNKGS